MHAMRASLLTRFGSAATVAALATGGVMATATAASAGGHPLSKVEATKLSIKNKPIAHGKHHADAIIGVLSARHKGVAGETITLDGRNGKHPRWMAIATGATNASGSVTFTVAPTTKSQFKLVFAGASGLGKSHSNVITLKAVKK